MINSYNMIMDISISKWLILNTKYLDAFLGE